MRKSTFKYVFTFSGGAICWRSVKQRGDTMVTKIASEDNLADSFTKSLSEHVFEMHVNSMGLKRIPNLL